MQQIIIVLALLFSAVLFGQNSENSSLKNHTLEVSVANVLNNKGTVNFAVYNKENFLKKPLLAKKAEIENGKSTVIFNELPNGIYAVVCYHDENENGRLDFYENGMPIESYGSSNNVMNYGPPDFDSAKFEIGNNNVVLEIKF